MSEDRIDLWYLIGSLKIGGANKTLVDLANGLDHDRFNVTIWTILDVNPLASELREEIELRVLDAAGKHDLPAAIRFMWAARQENPDIIQTFTFFDNILGRFGGSVSDAVVISGVRAVPESPSRPRIIIDKATLRLVDHVVSNSYAGRDMICNRGADPNIVSVIENGRNLQTYQNTTAPSTLRNSLGIPDGARLIGTVGRLIERKGHYDLLEAWPKIHKRNPNSHLLIVGDGPERDGLEQRREEIGCANSVTFAGERRDVPELLDIMDLFVFPSHFEGLPGALIEAMAAGLPIVATRGVGNEQLITHEKTGLLIPVRDPSELANSLNRLLDDNELASSLGRAATEEATERFSLQNMVQEFDELYRTLIHG